jgi:PAS domain S-box-containing protein
MAPLTLKTFIEESNDALAKIDGRGRVVLANRHWLTLVGPTAQGSVLDWPGLREALERPGREEQAFLTAAPGVMAPLAGALAPLTLGADPEESRLLFRIRPVEPGVVAARDRFFTLIDHFPFGIGVHRDLRFLYVNQAAVRYLGYDRAEELIGQPITTIIAPDDLPAVRQRVGHMMRTGQPLPERETLVVRRDGSTVVADLAAFMIRDEDGLPSYVVVARDITDRRQIEERLRQSQRMEAVGRLAGGIAHDFNNVLAVVLSYAELIANQRPGTSPGDDGMRRIEQSLDVIHAANEIRKAAERAAALVKELLTFSRGRLAEVSSRSPNAAVTDLRDFLERSLGDAHRLELDLAPELPAIRAGASHLEQVLVNLVINARDAMPGGGRVVVRTRAVSFGVDEPGAPPELDPGRYAVFEVQDSGIGMSPEVARRAFEPFFSTKGLGSGAGLGLATVYGIARQAGGTAEIASQPGHGTIVRVFWPLEPLDPSASLEAKPTAATPATAAPQAVSTAAPGAASANGPEAQPDPIHGMVSAPQPRRERPLEGRRILLVEDDEAVRILVTRLLKHNGAEVFEAHGADQAIALQEQLAIRGDTPPDLLLTDVVMPDKSGPELARELRRQQPRLRVVFMSGYADENLDADEIQQLGAHFIEKPFATQDLVELMVHALNQP